MMVSARTHTVMSFRAFSSMMFFLISLIGSFGGQERGAFSALSAFSAFVGGVGGVAGIGRRFRRTLEEVDKQRQDQVARALQHLRKWDKSPRFTLTPDRPPSYDGASWCPSRGLSIDSHPSAGVKTTVSVVSTSRGGRDPKAGSPGSASAWSNMSNIVELNDRSTTGARAAPRREEFSDRACLHQSKMDAYRKRPGGSFYVDPSNESMSMSLSRGTRPGWGIDDRSLPRIGTDVVQEGSLPRRHKFFENVPPLSSSTALSAPHGRSVGVFQQQHPFIPDLTLDDRSSLPSDEDDEEHCDTKFGRGPGGCGKAPCGCWPGGSGGGWAPAQGLGAQVVSSLPRSVAFHSALHH